MIQPTRPPSADRRARHEAAGEWPQPSLSQLLDARIRATADRPYFIEGQRDGGRTFTFGDLAARADRIAMGLRGLGVRQGDVVSWQLPNWFESAAVACAIDRLGAVSNPIITIYREREVAFLCRQAHSRVLIVPGEIRGFDHRDLATAVQRQAPSLEHVLTVRAEPAAGQRTLESIEATPDALPPSPHAPDDVAMIFYTSGTTADPKGVLHTSSTLGGLIHAHNRMTPQTGHERSILQFPMPHIGGITLFLLLQIRWGSSIVCMDTWDPALAVDLIERWHVTGAGGPPAVLQGMFAAPNFSREKMRSVEFSGSGAADVSPELMRVAKQNMDAFVYRSYGMTECPMFSAGRRGDDEGHLFGTDGQPIPGCAARLVDEAGRPVGPNVEGEIEAFGPQLCVGYLDPALNVAFTSDGYFRTGDLAIMDDAGYIRITGRRKDIIIRKGENLSAKGIEDDLSAHPAVADVAVIGVPDPASGERVCACVVLAPGHDQPTLAEVRTFMQARGVMMQKIPEQIEVLDELPRNATGKVRKDVLRQRYGAR